MREISVQRVNHKQMGKIDLVYHRKVSGQKVSSARHGFISISLYPHNKFWSFEKVWSILDARWSYKRGSRKRSLPAWPGLSTEGRCFGRASSVNKQHSNTLDTNNTHNYKHCLLAVFVFIVKVNISCCLDLLWSQVENYTCVLTTLHFYYIALLDWYTITHAYLLAIIQNIKNLK